MPDEVGLIEPGFVSCGESGLLGELLEGGLVVAVRRVLGWGGLGSVSFARLDWSSRVDVGDQHGVVQPGVGNLVTVGCG